LSVGLTPTVANLLPTEPSDDLTHSRFSTKIVEKPLLERPDKTIKHAINALNEENKQGNNKQAIIACFCLFVSLVLNTQVGVGVCWCVGALSMIVCPAQPVGRRGFSRLVSISRGARGCQVSACASGCCGLISASTWPAACRQSASGCCLCLLIPILLKILKVRRG